MADYRDVMNAERDADEAARGARHDVTLAPDTSAICGMLQAIRLEIRAAAKRADYARNDGR